jgi:hypothetical protein
MSEGIDWNTRLDGAAGPVLPVVSAPPPPGR